MIRQLISLLLSVCLLVSTVSPSYANLVRTFGAQLSKTGSVVARNSVRMSEIAAARNLTITPFKYGTAQQAAAYQLFQNGQNLSRLLPESKSKKNTAAAASSSGKNATREEMAAYIHDAVEQTLGGQLTAQQQLLLGFTQEQLASFSDNQIQEVFSWLFKPGTPESLQNKYFLNVIPQWLAAREINLTVVQYAQLLHYSRNILDTVAYQNPNASQLMRSASDAKLWSRAMAAVNNLALFGTAEDAERILAAARKAPRPMKDYTEVIAGRALLVLGADDALKELAQYSARETGSLNTPFWQDIARRFEADGQTLGVAVADVSDYKQLISAASMLEPNQPLNLIHLDMSAQATEDWVVQCLFVQQRAQVWQQNMPAAPQPTRPGQATPVQPTLTITQLPGGVAAGVRPDLTVSGVELSQPAAQSALQTSPVPSAQPAAGTISQPVPQAAATPSFWRRVVTKLKPDFLNRELQYANQSAQIVLNKPSPLVTQLRDILSSQAAVRFKKQALLRLYEFNVFGSFLAQQPEKVRNAVLEAGSDQARAAALWRLYEAHYLDPSIADIADVLEQGSLLRELQDIVTQSDWAQKAERAYEEETVVPFTGADHFSGGVPKVPEADLKNILATFRPDGFAVANKMKHVNTAKGSYYSNNIPFYYRNAKGELSSRPIGILTQDAASSYGRVLSALHLATQPGMTIASGFVLALDEQGQWKLIMPRGNLELVENNAASNKVLKKIHKGGSVRVAVDTPYSTTDLLAMAHMLEHNPALNLELRLNTPHSLKAFLRAHALFVGNDAGASLTGPFKESLKAVQGWVNTLVNAVSGIGYASPIAGGLAMPMMGRAGNVKTTQWIYGVSAAALAAAFFGLGMNGTVNPETLPLVGLALPTATLVFGASLANSFVPTFLNFYKDPTARTAANLAFATNKQMSRLGLTILTAALSVVGINWTIVVPVGLGLLGISYGLFKNTPMYWEAQHAKEVAAKEAEEAAEKFAKLTPEEQAVQLEQEALKKQQDAEHKVEVLRQYREVKKQLPEMQQIKTRVRMVYASYAASLMMLGQGANEVLGSSWGQTLVATCMAATFITRLISTRLVKRNVVTDDQLTGISLPVLALTGGGLAILPYTGVGGVFVAGFGIAHYMATAVPGQLDAARMQNIVTAQMRARKQKVEQDASLTAEQKNQQLDQLDKDEKVWSAQASKDYSLYNSTGLVGIGAATLGAFLFADMAPQWTAGILSWVRDTFHTASDSLAINRMLFAYSAGIAAVLAWKNRALTRDFWRAFRPTRITQEAIDAHRISAKTFGINKKNAAFRLEESQKQIVTLRTQLVNYGMMSEQKMTTALKQLTEVYNRLVAQTEIAGLESIQPVFDQMRQVSASYETILQHNDLSTMLHRQFARFKNHLYDGEGHPATQYTYMEEGVYGLPKDYDAYESARWLVNELDQLAFTLQQGQKINPDSFINYLNRAREDLLRYERSNPADSQRVAALMRRLDSICQALEQQADTLLTPRGHETPRQLEALQRLRDVLSVYGGK